MRSDWAARILVQRVVAVGAITAVVATGLVAVADSPAFASPGAAQLAVIAGASETAGLSAPGDAQDSDFLFPQGAAYYGGNLYVSDTNNCVVDELSPPASPGDDWSLSVVVGELPTASSPGPMCGALPGTGNAEGADAVAATSTEIGHPQGLAFNAAGDLFIADGSDCEIDEVVPGSDGSIADGSIMRYAGTGPYENKCGTNQAISTELSAGLGVATSFPNPYGLAVDSAGNLYVADPGDCQVSVILGAGRHLVQSFAGDGTCNMQNVLGGPSGTRSPLVRPEGVAVDSGGNVYIAQNGSFAGYDCDVLEVPPPIDVLPSDLSFTVAAGTTGATCGYSGDGDVATTSLSGPTGVAIDGAGNLVVSDSSENLNSNDATSCRILSVAATTVITIAGAGTCGAPKDGDALDSPLSDPAALAMDPAGDIYVPELANDVIEVTPPTTVVSNWDELVAAFAAAPAGGTTHVALGQGITEDEQSPNLDPPLLVPDNASVALDLHGQTLDIGDVPDPYAGIGVPSEASLTIDDSSAGQTGTLSATGSDSAAGIGGEANAGNGTVVIAGGAVTATGGNEGAEGGAGVGGGATFFPGGGGGGTVTVTGGSLTATGGDTAAGIGGGGAGGGGGQGGDVVVSGGTVVATGGGSGAGIGGGIGAAGGSLTVSGGQVTATGGDPSQYSFNAGAGAGVGGGGKGDAGGPVEVDAGGTLTATDGAADSSGLANAVGAGGGGSGDPMLTDAGSLTFPAGSNEFVPTPPATALLITGTGTLDNAGTIDDEGFLSVDGIVNNTGEIDVGAGGITSTGTVHNLGTIKVAPGGTVEDASQGGSLIVDYRSYVLSFDKNNGTGSTPDQSVYATSMHSVGLVLPTPTPPSNEGFLGWYVAGVGKVTALTDLPATFGLGTGGPVAVQLVAHYGTQSMTTYAEPGGTGDCMSEGTACSLSDAVATVTPGGTVMLASGSYPLVESLNVDAANLQADANSDPASQPTIDGSALDTAEPILVSSEPLTVTGITITTDIANPLDTDGVGGPGIETSAALTLDNSTVSETSDAGIVSTSGTLTLKDNSWVLNNAGPGVQATSGNQTVAVSDSTISGNGAGGLALGAFVPQSDGSELLVGANDVVSVTGSTITANGGNGLFADASSVTVTGSTISGSGSTDLATASGSTDPLPVTEVSNSTLGGSGDFGAILRGTSTLNNVTISGNGSGVDVPAAGSVLTLTDSTIADNQDGGIVGINGKPTLIAGGDIVAGNNVIGDPNPSASADCHNISVTDNLGNFDGDGTCFGGIGTDPADLFGSSVLGDNGGPTQTIALPTGSPAVGTNIAAFCGGTDQRGVARPATSCDAGAYELRAADSIALVADPTTLSGGSTYGDSVTLTATVTGSTGGAEPSGSVDFTADGASISCDVVAVVDSPPATDPPSATATCMTSGLAAGTPTLSAAYSDDPDYVDGSDTITDYPVAEAPQVITFNPALSATVGDTGTLVASGGESGNDVTFSVGGATTKSACSLSGADNASISYDHAGSCVIDADQVGDGQNYLDATPVPATIIVAAATPAVQLTASLPAGSTYGDAVTLTATVTGVTNGPVPEGKVDFTAGDSSIDCAAKAVAVADPATDPPSATATCTTTALAAGTPTPALESAYSDDPDYIDESDTITDYPVAKATPTIGFTPSSSAEVGDAEDLADDVAADGSTSQVTFSVDTVASAGACVLEADQVTVDYLHAGTCVVDANQAADANHLVASAVPGTIDVGQAPPSVSATVSPPTGSTSGQQVTITASVGPAGVAATPTGTVTFDVDGAPIAGCAMVNLTAGSASCVTTTLAVGTHTFLADYSGDSDYISESALVHNYQVSSSGGGGGSGSGNGGGTPPAQTITVTNPPSTGVVGGSTTITATGGDSGEPLVFTIDPATPPGVCTISGFTVTFVGPGVCLVDVNQSGGSSAGPAPQVQVSITISKPGATPPTIVVGSITTKHKRHHGWYRGDITVTFDCTAGSAPLAGGCPGPVTLRKSGHGQTIVETIAGTDGGLTTVTAGPFNLDLVGPSLHVHGVKGGHTYRGNKLRQVTCSAHDSLSGLAGSCHVQQKRNGRRVSVVVTATDVAGNVTHVHKHYFLIG